MKSCWSCKEDLYSFLATETRRLEKLIDFNFSEASSEKYEKFLNLFEQSSSPDLWIQNFLKYFPEYGKSSLPFLDPAPETWPTLADTWPALENENKKKKKKTCISDGFQEEQKKFFRENGVLGPVKIDCFKDMDFSFLDELINHTGEKSEYFFKSKKIVDLALNNTLLNKVRSLLGDNVVLLNDTIVFLNPQQNPEATHSDIQGGSVLYGDEFFRDDPGFLNVWISISGTDSLKAPLHFFPGTHLFNIIPILAHLYTIRKNPERSSYYANLFTCLEGNEHVRRSLRLQIETLKETFDKDYLKSYTRQEIYTVPGECIFFNSHVIHGSSPNLSNVPRTALVFRYRQARAKPLNFGFPKGVLKSCLALPKGGEAMRSKNHTKIPIVQVLGKHHHKDYHVIDIEKIKSHIN